ncbi:MAG TPA: nickel-responsive transcriptional regulator NikR [Polyangiaceae bacterium]|jgi:CopG family nickel-responsive transcriptional regulator|nr:nickel-responsive transcriptional regulator NikR [Polyangiaceae bacterium]
MKDNLVRFGVAMESSLIEELDALAKTRGCNRSELLRDLTRAEVSRTALAGQVPAFAAVTLVYNHHVRELSERLTALQHDLGEQVRSSMHVHLDHEHCLEVIVMRGRSDELREVTGRMIGTRGVVHGGAEFVAENTLSLSGTGRRVNFHEHDDGHSHAHPHSPSHPHVHPPAKAPSIKLSLSKAPRAKRTKVRR